MDHSPTLAVSELNGKKWLPRLRKNRARFHPFIQIQAKSRRVEMGFIPLKTLLSAPLRPPWFIFISLWRESERASD
jgi:hypothetical protein